MRRRGARDLRTLGPAPRHHRGARSIFGRADLRLVPEPVVVESDRLILARLGVAAEIAFLKRRGERSVAVEAPTPADRSRAAELAERYRDPWERSSCCRRQLVRPPQFAGAHRGRHVVFVLIEELASAWRARIARERADAEARAADARKRARDFAGRLVAVYGAREVWLFGSLAWGRPREGFDVDLAVAGLAHERYFAALAAAWEAIGAPVDLVPLEACAPSLRERILTHGERLDGR